MTVPVVHIPAELRDITGGARSVRADGTTLAEVIDALELRHPGLRARLVEDGELRPDLSAVIGDDALRDRGLGAPVSDASEIFFVRAISGGQR